MSSPRLCGQSSTPTIRDEVWCTRDCVITDEVDADVVVFIGGAANAYIPSPEEEQQARKQEEELIRVRTQSKDRIKEIEHERQERRKQSLTTDQK